MRDGLRATGIQPTWRLGVRAVGAVFVASSLLPMAAVAHERWFTPRGPYWDPEWGRLFSLPVLLALLSSAAMVGLLWVGQRVTGDPLWPRPPFFQRLEVSSAAILGVQTAITIIYAASRLDLFVPNIELPENLFGVLIAGIATIAAFSFITGVLTRIGALVIIALLFVALAFGAWYEVAEQIIFAGIALYLVAVGRGVQRYDDGGEEGDAWGDALAPYALTLLRVCAGLSVLILGFTEKLLAPDLGVAFLREYPNFNIAQRIGLTWFTDERFVLAVGIVEATAGVALLSGLLPRVVILGLWIPFNLGIAFLPAEELIGHLPILATMYVLLVRGEQGIPPRAQEVPERPAEHPASQLERAELTTV